MILFFIFLTIFLFSIIVYLQLRIKRLENETFECFKIQKKKIEKFRHSAWKEIQKLWDVAEEYEPYRINYVKN